jgi:hypothetical protein
VFLIDEVCLIFDLRERVRAEPESKSEEKDGKGDIERAINKDNGMRML